MYTLPAKFDEISWDEESAIDKIIDETGLWEGDCLRDYGPEYDYQMNHNPELKFSSTAFPIVLSGASGVGKTVLGKLILDSNQSLVESISCTTREPRSGEEDGRDYHFISKEEFLSRIEQNDFIEWAEVHGNYYGTPLNWIKETLNNNHCVFSILDVQGGLQMKKCLPETCLIFLVPPSLKELKARLYKRGLDTEESIKKRLKTAVYEHYIGLKNYEYIVENHLIENALANILACIKAHSLKRNPIRKEGISNE